MRGLIIISCLLSLSAALMLDLFATNVRCDNFSTMMMRANTGNYTVACGEIKFVPGAYVSDITVYNRDVSKFCNVTGSDGAYTPIGNYTTANLLGNNMLLLTFNSLNENTGEITNDVNLYLQCIDI